MDMSLTGSHRGFETFIEDQTAGQVGRKTQDAAKSKSAAELFATHLSLSPVYSDWSLWH